MNRRAFLSALTTTTCLVGFWRVPAGSRVVAPGLALEPRELPEWAPDQPPASIVFVVGDEVWIDGKWRRLTPKWKLAA